MALQSTALVLTAQNTPANVYNQTYPGNPYANTPGVTSTLLLGPDINPNIIPAWNQDYVSTLFMMSLPKRAYLNKTPVWYEQPYINAPVEVRAGVGGSVNGGSGSVTQVIPITDASNDLVQVGDKLKYPGDVLIDGIVSEKGGTVGSYTATVTSFYGYSLPALTAGQLLANAGNQRADAKGTVDSAFVSQVVQFNNQMEDMGDFAVRWDPQQSVVWENTGTTNYKAQQLQSAYKKYMSSIMQRIWMSAGGTITLPNGMTSMSTKGLLKQQEDAGVTITDITPANAMNVMREAIFDIQLSGNDDLIIAGTGRSLDKLSLGEKSERLRYSVGDKTYNMNMTRYEYWGHSIIPLRIDQWEDRGMYANDMADTLVLFRKSDVHLGYLKGWPMMSQQYKLANRQNSNPNPGLYDAEVVWWNALFCPIWEKAAFSARFRMNA